MLLPHHGFTILLTENPKVLTEISVSTLGFTKVLTVFAVKKLWLCVGCASVPTGFMRFVTFSDMQCSLKVKFFIIIIF